MSLDELRKTTGKEWPAIAKARTQALTRLEQVRKIVQEGAEGSSIDSEDISVVAFGSLAREEWTSGSDLDWTLLIDGGVDHEHAHIARHFRAKVEEAKLKQPDDPSLRDHFDRLPPNGEEKDQRFQEMIQYSRDFEQGLVQLFFDDDPWLASLTRNNSIF